MERVTIADVAKKAGVSKSTVSQFLNKRYEYMGEETRKKIEEAIKFLDYQPNYIARSLKQKRTSMIGVIVGNIVHRLSTEISRSIEDYCHENELHAIICNADDKPEKEKEYIEVLRAKQVDGLIIFPTGQNVKLYQDMVREGYPVVFMDRKVYELNANMVVVNNFDATYDAISQLVKVGHERIAIVTQPLITSTRMERVEGYKKALMDHHLPINPDYLIHSDIENMPEKLEILFSQKEKPSALFAGNDRAFLEVVQFLKQNKIKIGEDVSLIVFDNIPFAHLIEPSITIISQPAYEMGQKAAELLLRQVKKEERNPEQVIFQCEIDKSGTFRNE
ncbi:substrate-binding domain-containing protein [Neobacillus sp. PS3-40]|uniref:substrate-binding domain-containing protein n=1 Tax=Neobacillus sp. PS3-40 TaxID=3070679 RepID=UPI0027E1AA44|nr:substrate-binding domain-containing protein [Neobacillus sp. PS3-40]WML43155.1 substrate-binding domain-containing protein [Neobacillus sp. PS3-40]